jgi:hypothetical protein
MAIAPNAALAVVEDTKLTGYVMNPAHKDGWPKGQFLIAHGFEASDLLAVRNALLDHIRSNDVTEEELTAFGVKYRIDGRLKAPNGIVWVRTVWQIDAGQTAPRFVTMVPLPRRT